MTQPQHARVFGKRATQHTIIIASGERIRHITLRPWAAGLAVSLAATLAIGYFAATAYLVLRDDLIGATLARQARIQHAYEDRIAALRAQVDRVTSRQLLDQRLMETKVETLIAHQAALSTRHGRLDDLLDRADATVTGTIDAPLPTPRPTISPETHASATTALDAISMITEAGPVVEAGAAATGGLMAYAALRETSAERADRIFSEVTLSLRSIEQQQLDRVRNLTDGAFETADAIEAVLRRTGLDVPGTDRHAVGGPFIAPNDPAAFETSLDDLDAALTRLEDMRLHATLMPLAHPAPGKRMTSHYGTRKDPFLRRTAFHAGVDFSVPFGEPVIATGRGTVLHAGRQGGYGKMVAIDHGDGIITRYAHMSRIDVAEGQTIERGETLGAAGSTGRSTGTHLHYEVRRDGQPIDPQSFMEAGRSIEPLLALK